MSGRKKTTADKTLKSWRVRGCLINVLNSLSLQKKRVIANQYYSKCLTEILPWVYIRCSLFLHFYHVSTSLPVQNQIILHFLLISVAFSSHCCLSAI